jgi:NAD(P) transhydrogenase subunit alpha
MLIRVHRESRPGEQRVALVPRSVSSLISDGHQVIVPSGAGSAAGYTDDAFASAGADITEGKPVPVDLVAAVGPVTIDDVSPTGAVVAFLDPLGNPGEMQRFAAAGVAALAMELVPRSTQAQTMDALSSQATAAGYEAVLLAARRLPRFLPMMMTAAGTIPPARVLVIGAGVAGLQAIATARRLGAVVAGYDIRPAAAEQVQSLGATFVGGPLSEDTEATDGYAEEVSEEMHDRQLAALADHVANADIVITTAHVPGHVAPVLVTTDMIEAMRPGSVVVDLAAASGGNCEATVAGEEIDVGGVAVLGPTDLPSRTAGHASAMYSRNVTELIRHLCAEGDLVIDPEDEIAAAVCVTAGGEIRCEAVRLALEEAS